MVNAQSWRLLPPDLLELQIGRIDLLTAMYPEDVFLEEDSQKRLDTLRDSDIDALDGAFLLPPIISMTLSLLISDPGDERLRLEALKLDLTVSFVYEGHEAPEDPPDVKVRIQQPAWMSRAATNHIMTEIPEGEDLIGVIEHIKEAAVQHLVDSNTNLPGAHPAIMEIGPLVRVWFYFPSISTRSKRDDFIKYAPIYGLTGFLYAGKPGLLCVEGGSQSIDDYMKFIKTESWGDIPAHHKKVSERHREGFEKRVFQDMVEITDTVGERRGQRANRGDMKAIEEWLVERGLGDAFTKVLM
ncbi:hypothetical protein BKA66DRAFT_409422 [Pyrenochaeta sp. MPI-SDFR-AT-0127]|nr:hypothetical protein BKA66DRAFT_409422 [Pyrenochaeta sp. MPI-SDFR-AT-0127]